MKKIYFLMFCSLISFFSVGQTLTSANMPAIGDTIELKYVNVQGISPGNAGTGQIWSFTNLTDSATSTTAYVSPGATPHAADFPNANLASQEQDIYGYYLSTADEFSYLGAGTPQAVIPFDNSMETYRFPMSYQTSYTDSFTSTFTSGGGTFYRRGEIEVSIDATGDLTVSSNTAPSSTYSNVLRYRVEQNIQDSMVIMGSHNISNYSSVSYAFYHPDHNVSLFEIIHSNPGQPNSTLLARYTLPNDITIGIKPLSDNFFFSAYPNPARNTITIETKISGNNTMPLEIIDFQGRVVKSEVVTSEKTTIPIDNLQQGIYMLMVNGKVHQKIIKE